MTSIPQFALFGELQSENDPEFTHIETISSRSKLYDWQITPHTHRHMFQLVYVGAGTAHVHLDGRTETLQGPGVVTLPSGVVHAFSFAPGTTGHVVTMSDMLIAGSVREQSRALLEPLIKTPHTFDFKADPEQSELLEFVLGQMHLESKWRQPGRTSMFRWYLRIILMTLRRQFEAERHHGASRSEWVGRFGRFRALLEDHYRDHWSVNDYALSLAVSPSKLNRICHQVAGRPALDVIHDRVVTEAQRLLLYTDAPITSVADELGFKDTGYFCRFFKRRTGATPTTFRKRPAAQ